MNLPSPLFRARSASCSATITPQDRPECPHVLDGVVGAGVGTARTRVGVGRLARVLAGALMFCAVQAAEETAPSIEELLQAVRSGVPEASPQRLSEALARGMAAQFHPKVQFITNAAPGTAGAGLLGTTTVADRSTGYVRVRHFGSGLGGALNTALAALQSTNKLSGLILDFRFATGTDYAESASLADLFVGEGVSLLDSGTGMIRGTAGGAAGVDGLPLVVLVNSQSAGPAEAATYLLRTHAAAVVLGERTAGGALAFKEIAMGGGQRLLIASHPVKFAGDRTLSGPGLTPDVEIGAAVAQSAADLENPFRGVEESLAEGGAGATNRPSARRLNEAELVRRHKDGVDAPTEPGVERGKSGTSAGLVVADPVLARALDLVKGLRVLKPAGSKRATP